MLGKGRVGAWWALLFNVGSLMGLVHANSGTMLDFSDPANSGHIATVGA